jgi:hypothetical protein
MAIRGVMHLKNPGAFERNAKLARASADEREVRDVPDDGEEHPLGKWCPACSPDVQGGAQ